MSRWNLAWLIGILAIGTLSLTLSYSAPLKEKDKDYEMVRLLVDVLDKVDKNYVKELDADGKRRLIENMINGGLERLDPHSTFLNPKEYKAFNSQSVGKFGGIGIQINTDRDTGRLTVISPMVGTPAYEAGILAGDVVTKIDGKSTDTLRLNEAIEMIQGEPGEKITLTVVHEGTKDPIDVEMKRAQIELQTVQGDLRKADNPKEWDYIIDKDKQIAYIRVSQFSQNTTADLTAVVTQLKKDGVKGLVLDLRNNPGGLLNSAVDICNLFLTEGRIVSTKGRNMKEHAYDAQPGGAVLVPAKDYPLAILINRYSASASEIVSACLQDHNRAIIVGERSYGKGSVQNILSMENEVSALKLTTASYWRPSGHNIHRFPDSKDTDEWGVKPNEGFEVPLKDDERLDYMVWRRERDIVHGKTGTAPAPKPRLDKDGKPKPPFVDKVLEKAMTELRKQIAKDS
jgi:carboxyl-terminal processing protease